MITMKALRSFGVAGANEGKIKRGREFSAATEARAKDLEVHGLAYRLELAVTPPLVGAADVVAPTNKAAVAGPLGSPGGTIGAEAPAPSSPPDQPPRRRRSARSRDDELL